MSDKKRSRRSWVCRLTLTPALEGQGGRIVLSHPVPSGCGTPNLSTWRQKKSSRLICSVVLGYPGLHRETLSQGTRKKVSGWGWGEYLTLSIPRFLCLVVLGIEPKASIKRKLHVSYNFFVLRVRGSEWVCFQTSLAPALVRQRQVNFCDKARLVYRTSPRQPGLCRDSQFLKSQKEKAGSVCKNTGGSLRGLGLVPSPIWLCQLSLIPVADPTLPCS